MTQFNRRNFLKITGAASMTAALPFAAPIARAAGTPPKVVVIGAGFGGGTVAKYLRLWSNRTVDVTLVDPRAGTSTASSGGLYKEGYYSPILSNLAVTGQLTMNRIYIGYGNLANPSVHGVLLKKGSATVIDPVAKTVTVAMSNGTTEVLPYDKLVLAPGIDFISPNLGANPPGFNPPGDTWNPNVTPHAWTAGAQTALLKTQLTAMTSTGLYVLTIPKSPYRCPPGPYERACVVADYLMRKKAGAKILVLDQNAEIQAEPKNFGNAFNNRYKSVLTYKSGVVINKVVSSQKRIETNVGTWDQTTALGKVQVLNVIPNQRAPGLIYNAFGPGQSLPLDASGRWASIDPLTYASVGYPDIHIVGDAQASRPPNVAPPAPLAAQPKSGTMANSQAKVCADAILRAFNLDFPDPAPTTNSACYSPISSKDASWLNANYQYNPAYGVMERVPGSFGEAEAPSGDYMEDMFTWADNLFADSMK